VRYIIEAERVRYFKDVTESQLRHYAHTLFVSVAEMTAVPVRRALFML
jgi:hypothetical protein